jgi:hypothetical protein
LKANIFLLLTNPGISPASTQATHNLYIEEWGIANLSTYSTSNWYRPRFKKLLDNPEDENEWKKLSNSIAMIQAVPWASKCAKSIKLPSADLMLDLVRELVKINQKSIFIIMRNKKFWMQALHQTDQSRVIINPNPRNTFISNGNFGADWVRIKQALINSESNLI